MIKSMSVIQCQKADKTAENLDIVIQKQETMEKRLDKLENGGAAKGEDNFIERHKTLIDQAKYGIKVLGMQGKVTELNAKTYLRTELDLTKATMDTMGISQAYRLGKNPINEGDSCPPVIIVFSTKDMVEIVINAARGEGKKLQGAHSRSIFKSTQ